MEGISLQKICAITLAAFSWGLFLCITSFVFSPPQPQLPTANADEVEADITPEIQAAVERGLEYLARTQNANGSWSCIIGYKVNFDYTPFKSEAQDDVGVTALAAMSMMANGSLPNRGRYGDHVARGLQFVLSCVRDDGYITRHGTRMYSHAFATLFLAQVYGATSREDVRDKLKRAVNLSVAAQNENGGWRYQPLPLDSDISVTVSVLQALRAARDVGIHVPRATIEKAMNFIKNCHDPRSGGFRYQIDYDGRITYALTACGVTSLYSAGEYQSEMVSRGLHYLETHFHEPYIHPTKDGKYWLHSLYAHFYAAQAMYQAGGARWKRYWNRVTRDLIANQRKDGTWDDDVGPTYAAAMATLILQVPNEYLPIFQK